MIMLLAECATQESTGSNWAFASTFIAFFLMIGIIVVVLARSD